MMLQGREYRQLVVKMIEANPRTVNPKRRFQESWDTVLFGLTSIVIGVAILITPLRGTWKVYWSGSRAEKSPDSNGGWATTNYFHPNVPSATGAMVGECVGLVGILVGRWRRSATSILCALGIAICLLHIILFYVHVRFLT
jgi:hypothetical protein